MGFDTNADDAIDDTQVSDNFDSNSFNLAYDNNGNLTDDGVYLYVYDAWNRLVKVTRRPSPYTVVATYAYDAANRRTKKVVSNCGVEVVPNDGGNTTVHFYYGSPSPDRQGGVPWNVLETRNGSDQTTWQYVWGTQYVDELILADKNGDGSGNELV